MAKVVVLGGSGMLGSMVADVLARAPEMSVTATVRDGAGVSRSRVPGITWRPFSWEGTGGDLSVIDGHDWVINCIGITKPLIRDDNPVEVERAVRVNAVLPYALADRARDAGARVIQIATDCVYSGSRGMYRESDAHDALDVYGKTKSLGEIRADHVHHLRCSIIGPEPKEFKFLLEWFRRQPKGASLRGFRNHRWNGVTTLAFARLCLGIITDASALPETQHVVPADVMTKAEMLHTFARVYRRADLAITDVDADVVIDRTLATNTPDVSAALWRQAGYAEPPTVAAMIEDVAAFDYRFG